MRSNAVTTVCTDTEGVIERVHIYEAEINRSSSLRVLSCALRW